MPSTRRTWIIIGPLGGVASISDPDPQDAPGCGEPGIGVEDLHRLRPVAELESNKQFLVAAQVFLPPPEATLVIVRAAGAVVRARQDRRPTTRRPPDGIITSTERSQRRRGQRYRARRGTGAQRADHRDPDRQRNADPEQQDPRPASPLTHR